MTSLTASTTRWPEKSRIIPNMSLVPKPCPLSRIASRISLPPRRCLEGRERCRMLAHRLSDGATNHQLEDLVLREARRTRRGDVLIGNLVGLPHDLVDQCPQRGEEAHVVERRPSLGARRTPVAVQDLRHQCLARLTDRRHAHPPARSAATRPNISRTRPQSPSASKIRRISSRRAPKRSRYLCSSSTRVVFLPSGMKRISISVLRFGSYCQSAVMSHE